MVDEVCTEERLEDLLRRAASVHVVMKDIHAVSLTMKNVGFTEQESKDHLLQQKVRRMATKLNASQMAPLPAVFGDRLLLRECLRTVIASRVLSVGIFFSNDSFFF